MTEVKILVADDHELVRDGIKIRLERQPGWRVCAEADNGRKAVELARQFKPDIAVLDIGMAELNGIEAAAQIRKSCPQTEVLILTMQETDDLVRQALHAGARAYLLKTDTPRLLVDAIEALLKHQPFFSGRVAGQLLGELLDPAQPALGVRTRLSARESEIIQLLAEARSSKEIAARLSVSVNTVDAHRANIMRKLGLHSIAELVRYAVRNRIIDA